MPRGPRATTNEGNRVTLNTARGSEARQPGGRGSRPAPGGRGKSPAARGSAVLLLALFAVLNASPAATNPGDERKCLGTTEAMLRRAADERALLAEHAAFIKRVGATLELTAGNKVLKFEDTCDELREDDRVLYHFVDYFGDLDQILIQEDYYEGRGYSLVERKNGVRKRIDAPPIFSPNRAHFLTVDIGEPGYSPNRLQIWRRLGQDWFEMVWSFQPYESWAGASAKWLDDRTIIVTKKVSAKPQRDASVDRRFSIRLGTDGWRIVDDPRRVK